MKKLIYDLILPAFFLISACQSNNISKIASGVKVIGKRCKNLSLAASKSTCPYSNHEEETKVENETKDAEYINIIYLLPSNSWDAKMMIW